MNTTIESCKDEKIQCFSNVTKFTCLETTKEPQYAWEITYDAKIEPENPTVPIYFILDTVNQNAFSHWVYENALWLPYYLTLREKYPSMRLVIEKWKDFKKIYFQYYNIPLESVCLQSDIEEKNYCFFHTYTSFNDKNVPQVYYDNVNTYKEKVDSMQIPKSIPILYLPRGTKENLAGASNRIYNVQNDLKEYVVQLGGTVYETDSTTNLEQQIQKVKQSSIILLDYGSNLWVNGLFAEKSHIICLNLGWHQHPQYPAMGYLWNKIHESNTLHQIFAYTSIQSNPEDIATVCFHIPTILQEILSSLQRAFQIPMNI